jgi:hypothetical protein
MKLKLIVTGKTFPVKAELVSLGAQWRPDKGGFLVDSTPMIKYYIEQLKRAYPRYKLDYYEVDEDQFVEKPNVKSNLRIAKSNVKKVMEILNVQHSLLLSDDFDQLEANADKYREEVIEMLEYVKAYILNKPVDTTLRLKDKKESNCHAMLCGSTIYSLALTKKARLNASVYNKRDLQKTSLSVDGYLEPEIDARFMKI